MSRKRAYVDLTEEVPVARVSSVPRALPISVARNVYRTTYDPTRLSLSGRVLARNRSMAPAASRGFFGPQRRGSKELKVIDTAAATYACDTTGSVTLINGVATGSDYSNRIGRKITIKSAQLMGLVQPEASAASGPTKYRVMLVWDSQPNGVIATIADIFTAATSAGFLNLANRERFRVLKDVQGVIGYSLIDTTATQAVAVSPNPGCRNVSVFKRLNLDTIYDGTGAVIGDVQTGALLLVTIGNLAAGANFIGAARVRFTDA